jgi:hypothetical protein
MPLSKHIEELCQAVSQEADGEKLLSLVDELNKELEHASEARPQGGLPQPSQSDKDNAPQPSHSQESRGGKPNAA